jgi:hypothetical protein
MAERILSRDEIAQMEKLTADRLVEAIDAGAKKIAQRMYNEFLSMHDLYRNWIAAALSFVGRRFGDQVLQEAMDEGSRTGGAESGKAATARWGLEGAFADVCCWAAGPFSAPPYRGGR